MLTSRLSALEKANQAAVSIIILGISVLGSVRHGPDPYSMVPQGTGRLGFKAKIVRRPEALAHARPRGSGRDQCQTKTCMMVNCTKKDVRQSRTLLLDQAWDWHSLAWDSRP